MLGDAVAVAVSANPDVTQAIAFRWRKRFYQRETLVKRSGSIANMPRRRVAKIVVDKIYHGGRHSEMILLIFLKKK